MRRWLTIALAGLVLSCQGPAAVLAREGEVAAKPAAQVTRCSDCTGATAPPVNRSLASTA